MLILFVFLGFFLGVIPLSIYLFAKLVPDRLPDFIGFPENPVGTPAPPEIVGPDDPEAD